MSIPPAPDHHHQRLFQSGTNKAVYCRECDAFHIHFGNVSLDLSEVGIDVLYNSLWAYHEFYRETVKDPDFRLDISTPYRGFRLYLSLSEIRDFLQMLRFGKEAYLKGPIVS